jgi:hypothetical protein
VNLDYVPVNLASAMATIAANRGTLRAIRNLALMKGWEVREVQIPGLRVECYFDGMPIKASATGRIRVRWGTAVPLCQFPPPPWLGGAFHSSGVARSATTLMSVANGHRVSPPTGGC